MLLDHVRETGITAFRGDVDKVYTLAELRATHKARLMRAFLEDDEIQEITITSANLGIVLTYTKISVDSAAKLTQEKAAAH
jgi:diphthamide synthase subunit DPH2